MIKLKNELFFLNSAISVLLVLFSMQATADWSLNNNASSLYYVSNKVSSVAEVNSFSELTGSINESGNAALIIELSSVDTAIDARTQRVKDILFQVANYPQAVITMDVDIETLQNMEVGFSSIGSFQASLGLHGLTQEITVDLQITKLDSSALQVQLVRPLIINAATFNLAEGVEELREIAGLDSINNNVIVDFTLLFEETL